MIFSICSGRRKTLGLENFLMSSSAIPSSVSISCLLFTTRLLSLLTGSLKIRGDSKILKGINKTRLSISGSVSCMFWVFSNECSKSALKMHDLSNNETLLSLRKIFQWIERVSLTLLQTYDFDLNWLILTPWAKSELLTEPQTIA